MSAYLRLTLAVTIDTPLDATAAPAGPYTWAPDAPADVNGAVHIGEAVTIQGSPDELYRLADKIREAARLASEMHQRIAATAEVLT